MHRLKTGNGMNTDIEILDWDSAFFKVKTCRINSAIPTNSELANIQKQLKKLDIGLGYYSALTPLNVAATASEFYNIYLVDKKTTYLKKHINGYTVDNAIAAYEGDYPGEQLIELAISSGEYSRFKVDKNIGKIKCDELYRDWIISSVNRRLAKEVLVHRSGNIITGFVTLGEKNSIADIGLIAVDSNYRGKGIGKCLMMAAESWSVKNHYDQIQVVTQAANLPACKLYKSCGYELYKQEYFYHFWSRL